MEGEVDTAAMTTLRQTMSGDVGVIRNGEGLKEAIRQIDALERANRSARFRNTLTTAKLIATAALSREESRGGHFREDCPEEREEWHHRTYTTLEEANAVVAEVTEREPV